MLKVRQTSLLLLRMHNNTADIFDIFMLATEELLIDLIGGFRIYDVDAISSENQVMEIHDTLTIFRALTLTRPSSTA